MCVSPVELHQLLTAIVGTPMRGNFESEVRLHASQGARTVQQLQVGQSIGPDEQDRLCAGAR
jgi:hypothetical protein